MTLFVVLLLVDPFRTLSLCDVRCPGKNLTVLVSVRMEDTLRPLVSDLSPPGVESLQTSHSGFLVTWHSDTARTPLRGVGGLQEQRRLFSRRLHPSGELPHSGHEAVGERGEVVARVQDVGLAAFAVLHPH